MHTYTHTYSHSLTHTHTHTHTHTKTLRPKLLEQLKTSTDSVTQKLSVEQGITCTLCAVIGSDSDAPTISGE